MNRPPISRLPSETLSRIFWFATAPKVYWGYNRGPPVSDAQRLIQLGSVCSQWHRATRSSPKLWSTLTLYPTKGSQVTHYTTLLRFHLERVGANGLSIYLFGWEEAHKSEIEEILRIILCEHPGKLKSLHVGGEGRGQCRAAWPLLIKYAGDDREFPELEELELAWTPSVVEEQPNEIPLFRNSPRLRTLSLYANQRISHMPFRFPLPQLTKLRLRDISLDFALECLSKCPELTEFSYSGYSVPSNRVWNPIENGPVTINSLRRLSWTAISNKPVDIKLFNHFRFPSLHYLEWDRQLPSNAPPVRDFFAQMENLQELRFSPLLDPEEEFGIEHHLHCFNNLLKLKMSIIAEDDDDPSYSHGWFHRLTFKPGTQNLFPHLQKLHLTVSDVAPHGLLVILCSRRNGPVDWSDPNEQDPEDLVVQLYDPTSAHWKDHSRLMQFKYEAYDLQIQMDWTWSPHYPALQTMISEAKIAENWEQTSGSKIVF
ncbi:hypothetical protein D9756_007054 [Leucocoprinus leucothites]|uniref:F-box domain-containing protein n=1 Tax=Leucocoprinus leucothites TaxID=201217 RepID=A0A8H5FYI4_9AGAR|nr:hypothetical protein D9756_007054 [Leucoagaricus leucothites]